MNDGDLIVRKQGRAGRITLNRPDALNALSYSMVLGIENALKNWEADGSVSVVIIDGAGDRAFCAGGDIEDMYKAGLEGNFDYGAKFWRDEYRLNAYIAKYSKPYVAIMHGFVMGGGVGISAHGSHRIVTDGSMVAMPECGIGLIPDVGGTHLLGKAPGNLGEFAGLTGFRMGPSDAIHMGFADYYVPQDLIAPLVDDLSETGDVQSIDDYRVKCGDGQIKGIEKEANDIFSLGSLEEVVSTLGGQSSDWAIKALRAIQKSSPIALKCTLSLIRTAREIGDLEAALENEFAVTSKSTEHGDFLEGIRAAIIDKDRNPKWKHETLGDVPKALIERMLEPDSS